jgi:thiol-disulfide isomerase/thioredoxin
MTRYRNALLAGIAFIAVSYGLPGSLFAQSPIAVPVSALKATTDASAESTDKEILHTVEQIREDVRALRHEVDNLRTLLESLGGKSGSSNSPERFRDGVPASAGSKEPLPANGVYFFDAAWCGPCQQMRPIVERLKCEGLPIVDVDVDRRPDLKHELHVSTIPVCVLMVGAKEKRRSAGLLTEAQLRKVCAMVPSSPSSPSTSAPSKPGLKIASTGKTDPKTELADDAAGYQADTAPHDSPRETRGAAAKSAEYELRSYPVADLVVPTPGKPKTPVNGNLERLIGLLPTPLSRRAGKKRAEKVRSCNRTKH